MTTQTTATPVFQKGDRIVCADGITRTVRHMAPRITGEPAHVVVEDGTQWIAANCHRANQGHLTAICVKTQAGHRLRVLSEADTRDLVRLDLGWNSFQPASAEHHLIKQGYMIRTDAQRPETASGCREIPGQDHAWSASVVPIRTPAQIDAYLRTILAADAYLGFQQAIGERVLDEAVQDAKHGPRRSRQRRPVQRRLV